MKTSLLIGLLGVLLFASGCSGKKAKKEPLHFFIAGHITDSASGIYKPFAEIFPKSFNDKSIDFAVFSGDIVPESTQAAWDTVDKLLKPCPYKVYFAPGKQDLTDRKLYEKRYGNPDKYFEMSNMLFVIWDVSKNGWNVSDEQKAELFRRLSEQDFDQLFIFTHEVIWYDPVRTPQIIPNTLEGKADKLHFYDGFLQKLKELNIPVYLFSGGVGAKAVGSELTIHRFENVRMIASGMGGGVWDNFIDVQIKKGKTKVEVHYVSGREPLNLNNIFIPVAP